MSGIVFQFGWRDEETPQFQYGTAHGLEAKPLSFDENLSLSVADGPQCAGYFQNGGWHPCPTGEQGSRRCEHCKKQEGLAIEQFCDGYNLDLFSAADLERLNTPHYLYLALFEEGTFKVGVSAQGRGFLRQIEQGSHFSLIIAEGMNGIVARQMETFLRRCGIPDKIMASQKKDFLFPHLSAEKGRQILEEIAQKYLPSLLFDHPELRKYIREPFEFKNFASFYHLEAGEASDRPFHALTLGTGDAISGKLLSVKGSFLLLELPMEKVMLNAKDLLGFAVDFNDRPVGMELQTAFQGALF